ncbi:glycerol kinase GlpK [Benzoatithermus flavus]|uniref:Glycerol kinase n=1 Tax=Benzoatithermus flavus TaxID=3108223 RepID=A0ABU8XW98_9PROT
MSRQYVLAIDQGTTSSRAILFDREGRIVGTGQKELRQHFPKDGWVEHDPEDIWRDTLAVCRQAIHAAGVAATDIAAIGITNQRETTVLWERDTGSPVHNAIVWQDRRTAETCRELVADGIEERVRGRTGLVVDAYFSGTKLAWLLDHVPGARSAAEHGALAFGTVDSFLLWRLTGGRVHATDATNASRTMLFDIVEQTWDEELLRALRIPPSVLPEVRDCSGSFGIADPELFGAAIPILGIAGDQQAATIGQACFLPGMSKSTYGTGCFMLVNTGERFVASRNRLLTTVAYRLDGRTTYALEGSIFVAGAAVQWLRDGLGIIRSAAETEELARDLPDNEGVYLVPAFTGLGAPHWDPDARGAILGLTRDSGVAHIVRAALESVAYQTLDLVDAMTADMAAATLDGGLGGLRVDGGMVVNDWVCQFLADILNRPVERPAVVETTALGAAYLAGLAAGVYASLPAVAGAWRLERRFEPGLAPEQRERLVAGWRQAVRRVRS